uniref:Putative multicopper oxidase n=1 Tax=Lutzomyia longipalpis TaxID=7200 RepID=A0A7G3ARV2_LUTLO
MMIEGRMWRAFAIPWILFHFIQVATADCDYSKCVDLHVDYYHQPIVNAELVQCCANLKDLCDKTRCPLKPVACKEEFHEVVMKKGVCCDEYKCAPPKDKCIVRINGRAALKNLGDTWDSDDPCTKHICDYGMDGKAQEKTFKEYCYHTCNNEYELKIIKGQCCGQCVQTKCKFNDTLYSVGETWKSEDHCALYECTKKDDTVTVASYTKQCPKLPACKKKDIYVKDCCQYCNPRHGMGHTTNKHADPEDEDYNPYDKHPCKRPCVEGAQPMVCRYKFIIEWYETLSKACYNCPFNATDCFRPHCITGDGSRRSVLVVNRKMPGPAIDVCQGDTIVVDVQNNLLGETTTIHWHGLHQRRTPYMDGVPLISQCPISQEQTFRYTFYADNAGTHFWHSHTGVQRGDGALGPLIVRCPPSEDVHYKLYDYDKIEHLMILQDWTSLTGISMFNAHHHSNGDNKPKNILINGRGRFLNSPVIPVMEDDSEMDLAASSSIIEPTSIPMTTTDATAEATTFTSETTPGATTTSLPEGTTTTSTSGAISTSTTGATSTGTTDTTTEFAADFTSTTTTTQSSFVDEATEASRTYDPNTDFGFIHDNRDPTLKTLFQHQQRYTNVRNKRETPAEAYHNYLNESQYIPLQVYHVAKDKKFRFRLINAEFLNCPMEMSIDNHTMLVIASDGSEIEPIEIDSLVSYAGERFDFVVHANQKPGNYWIRVKGLMDCDQRFTSAHQVAILRYAGAPEEEPKDCPTYDYVRPGRQLNALNRGMEDRTTISIAETTSAYRDPDNGVLQKEADFKFYIYYDFYAKNNTNFHIPGLYGFQEVLNDNQRRYTPQLNHISMQLPTFPLMPARHMIDDSQFCNSSTLANRGINCKTEFCECSHVLQVPLNAIVELVLIDEGFTYDANHPFHLHGSGFHVIGMERLAGNISAEIVQELDRSGKLYRRLKGAPIKDTVTIPDGGYTIVRFRADNPGYWLFHCHIEFHAEIGMSLVFKVGEHDEMLPVPENFPTCSDYMPDVEAQSDSSAHRTTVNSFLFLLIAMLLRRYFP